MIYLLGSIACSLGIATVFKANEERDGDRSVLLAANYVVAGVVGVLVWTLGWGGPSPGFDLEAYPAGLMGLIALTGGLFIGTYYVLAWATREAGMGLATGVMRVSVVLPVLASWIVWEEVPTAAQGLALVLAAVAFFYISDRGTRGARGLFGGASGAELTTFGVLFLLFLAGGVVDTCIKAFDEQFAASHSDVVFLTAVYLVAAVIGCAVVLGRWIAGTHRPTTSVLRWGVLLGFLNYAATILFLKAVRHLFGPFVFPANSISIVLGSALIGTYFWNERLTRRNRIGLALAVIALVLLRV